MDKSIMAMADDILGGALSNPAKAQSQLSNPYNEPELPELSDAQRESMMNESTNHLNCLIPNLDLTSSAGAGVNPQ